MRLQLITIFAAFAITAMAVPELEHDRNEFDSRDCKAFAPSTCLRECPRKYVAVYRNHCFAAEDQHECCGVICCRSRQEDDQETEDRDVMPASIPGAGGYASPRARLA